MAQPTVDTLKAQVDALEQGYQRLRTTIFGNGGDDGLKGEIIKLRQALRIATFLAGGIMIAMVGDFATRVFSIQPADVKEAVETTHKDQMDLKDEIRALVRELREEDGELPQAR